MLQQIIAIFIIALFIWRLILQKKKQKINRNEFLFWLTFWLLGIVAIIFIRQIDSLLIFLGFSGSGINFLLYLAVLALFYLIFKLRLDLAKMDTNLTKITRLIALNQEKENKNKLQQ
ncbi:MAG: hypothetical protein PWQ35_231 [Patescibacteria group bacterium]|nr:hypothetical protein [Patescibacteria group bacterium]